MKFPYTADRGHVSWLVKSSFLLAQSAALSELEYGAVPPSLVSLMMSALNQKQTCAAHKPMSALCQ